MKSTASFLFLLNQIVYSGHGNVVFCSTLEGISLHKFVILSPAQVIKSANRMIVWFKHQINIEGSYNTILINLFSANGLKL
ncbi:hypothetical protein S83_063433 [Arachis hypogaea]